LYKVTKISLPAFKGRSKPIPPFLTMTAYSTVCGTQEFYHKNYYNKQRLKKAI